MDHAWDENTIDVAFDALHEATRKGDVAEANRLANLISNSLRNGSLSLAGFVPQAFGELDDAVCAGAALAMFTALAAHARKTDDLTLFGRLLAHRTAERALGLVGNGGLLVPAFIAAVVDAARAATPQYRYEVCLLLSNQERLFGLDLVPLGEFLFSCLSDKPGKPRQSSAKLAGWLIDEHIRRGGDGAPVWRAELARRAAGSDARARTRLRSRAKLAALDADRATPDSTVQALVTTFLAAKPRQQHTLHVRLIDAVIAEPSVAGLLPLPWTLPADAPRFAVGQLKLLALRELGDVEGLRAYLAAAPEPLFRSAAGYALGNVGKKARRAPFAPILGPLLRDEDAAVRYATLYFFTQLASEEQGELAPWAHDLVRLTSDATRPPSSKEFVSSQARSALLFALKATKARQEFVNAAQKWSLECDAKQRRLFTQAARELLPELFAKK